MPLTLTCFSFASLVCFVLKGRGHTRRHHLLVLRHVPEQDRGRGRGRGLHHVHGQERGRGVHRRHRRHLILRHHPARQEGNLLSHFSFKSTLHQKKITVKSISYYKISLVNIYFCSYSFYFILFTNMIGTQRKFVVRYMNK